MVCMCTAMTYQGEHHYFGRTLDYELSYGESVTVTPRRFPIAYRYLENQGTHFAYLGMSFVKDNYPLYYDGVNEKGLCIAGLLFPKNAVYLPYQEGKENLTPYELIPRILGHCRTVAEAKTMLSHISLIDSPFSGELPLSPMHWMIADSRESITVEPMEDGLHIYDNPIGVLANNPPFPMQMFALNQYPYLSDRNPKPCFCGRIPTEEYCYGLGSVGLPGGLSSQERFVRIAFHKLYGEVLKGEEESVNQFFHILGTVEQPKGSSRTRKGKAEYTVYTACCNMERGIYYYTGYNNRQITGVDMHREDLDGNGLISYPVKERGAITMQ